MLVTLQNLPLNMSSDVNFYAFGIWRAEPNKQNNLLRDHPRQVALYYNGEKVLSLSNLRKPIIKN